MEIGDASFSATSGNGGIFSGAPTAAAGGGGVRVGTSSSNGFGGDDKASGSAVPTVPTVLTAMTQQVNLLGHEWAWPERPICSPGPPMPLQCSPFWTSDLKTPSSGTEADMSLLCTLIELSSPLWWHAPSGLERVDPPAFSACSH